MQNAALESFGAEFFFSRCSEGPPEITEPTFLKKAVRMVLTQQKGLFRNEVPVDKTLPPCYIPSSRKRTVYETDPGKACFARRHSYGR